MIGKKYKVVCENKIVARDMRIDDALIFIKFLCNKYFNNSINITLLDNNYPEAQYNGE